MNQDTIIDRTIYFLNESTLPISRFARAIGIDRSTYYRWVKHDLNFSEKRLVVIDEFLKKFGF